MILILISSCKQGVFDVFVLLHAHRIGKHVCPEYHALAIQSRLAFYVIFDVFGYIAIGLFKVPQAFLVDLLVVQSVSIS
jgi:hypothetical protein